MITLFQKLRAATLLKWKNNREVSGFRSYTAKTWQD